MTHGKDILIDLEGDGDLIVRDGDFVIGDSDQQNVKLLLEADKGQVRFWPLIGAGIRRHLGGPFDDRTRRDIQLQLQADGYSSLIVVYNNGVLSVFT